VAKTLDGNGLLLDLLEALAEADSLATGPGVWSPWKRRLISDLARRCRSVLAGEPLPAPCTPSAASLAVAGEVAADGRPQIRLEPTADPPTALVAMPDRVGSLSAAAGVLALHSLEVHAAELNTVDGVALLRFTVSPRFGGLPDPAVLRSELSRVLEGTLELDEALARKERDYAPMAPAGERPPPPRVLWFDDEATGAMVVELRGTDRIGLLHQVAAALEACEVDLRWARVATLGASVVDSFGLAGPCRGGRLGPADRRRIEQAMLAAAR
jgi:[protein-PII] uridylyltransferase